MTGRRADSVGILGGTFDPIHYGHLAIAEGARDTLGLARVLFVPAGVPPHKRGRVISAAEHRVAMVKLAIAGDPSFELSRIEVDRAGPSYAVDTLELLIARALAAGGKPDFTFILSAESFDELPTWRDPRRLLSLCRIAVAPRGGYAPRDPGWLAEHAPGQADRVTFLDGPHLVLSGSEIRQRAAAGRSIRYLVPDAVAAYIADHLLYKSHAVSGARR